MIRESLIREFKTALGDSNVFTGEADRCAYSYDSAVIEPVLPALVLRPGNIEAMGKAIRLCHDNNLPLTVRGAGTNLSGGTVPRKESVVLLTTALDRIIEINEQDMYAIVEPGVVTARFATEVAKRGLFYPPDPGSQTVSTLGGNVAENAGGLRGLKYGVTKNYVMGVNFFDAAGDWIKTGSKTVKCVTGLNLPGLMVASEGILGVFAEIILRLVPPPQTQKALMATFNETARASQTVAAIIAAKIVPATLEFLDNFTIRAVEEFSKAGLPVDAQALLLIEVDGHPAQVAEEAAKVEEICRQMGATRIQVANSQQERNKVWEARRAALSALARLRPTTVIEDATVPRSKIPDMIRAIEEIARKHALTIGVFGHAGDGNLHPTILTDRTDKLEWQHVEQAIDEIFATALALGGTLSGEHGIGLAKLKYMEQETNKASVLYSQRLKKALDPRNILNPGKLVGE